MELLSYAGDEEGPHGNDEHHCSKDGHSIRPDCPQQSLQLHNPHSSSAARAGHIMTIVCKYNRQFLDRRPKEHMHACTRSSYREAKSEGGRHGIGRLEAASHPVRGHPGAPQSQIRSPAGRCQRSERIMTLNTSTAISVSFRCAFSQGMPYAFLTLCASHWTCCKSTAGHHHKLFAKCRLSAGASYSCKKVM